MLFELGNHLIETKLPFFMSGCNLASKPITVGTANDAMLYPLFIGSTFLINGIKLRSDIQSGNMDVGIYDRGGNLLVSSGSVAMPTTTSSTLQSLPTTELRVGHNPFWIALALDNTTGSFRSMGTSSVTMNSFRRMIFNSSFPLPLSLNLGSPSSRSDWSFPAICLQNSMGLLL